MGVDKANIRTVIHRDMPPSVEAYLQESGRGGRDRKPAFAVLLCSPSDRFHSLKPSEGPDSTDGYGRGSPDNPVEIQRYQAMLRYATSGDTCRREFLLGLLSAEPEACFGCDVCSGDICRTLPGLESILKFIVHNPRQFTLVEAAQILCGISNRETADRSLWLFRGYASLSAWQTDEVEEAIAELLASSNLAIIKRGPWKTKLVLTRDRTYNRRSAAGISLMS